MTRLVWVLLVVCVFAGCGGSDRTLKNLSYSDLTALREIEVKHLYEEKNGTDEYYGVAQRLYVINTLRHKAWERECKATGIEPDTIEKMRQDDKENEEKIKKMLNSPMPPNFNP